MVGEVYQCRLTGNVPGDNWAMVLHYLHSGGGTADHAATNAALLLAVGGQIVSEVTQIQADVVQWTAGRAQCVSQPFAPVLYTPLTDTGALAATDALPSQNAVLVTKRGANGGRQNVGKTYIIGVGENLVDGDVVDVNAPTMIAVAAAFALPLTSGSYEFTPVIWHAEAQTHEVILSSNMRSLISRQTRRRSRL